MEVSLPPPSLKGPVTQESSRNMESAWMVLFMLPSITVSLMMVAAARTTTYNEANQVIVYGQVYIAKVQYLSALMAP